MYQLTATSQLLGKTFDVPSSKPSLHWILGYVGLVSVPSRGFLFNRPCVTVSNDESNASILCQRQLFVLLMCEPLCCGLRCGSPNLFNYSARLLSP